MPYEENDLFLKLFTTHHLNVPERKIFPNGKIPASKVCTFIEDLITENGWFPGNHSYPEGDAGGEYLQLEKTKEEILLHTNTESSYCRFSHKTERFSLLADAINAFLKAKENDLDGLSIDWQL